MDCGLRRDFLLRYPGEREERTSSGELQGHLSVGGVLEKTICIQDSTPESLEKRYSVT